MIRQLVFARTRDHQIADDCTSETFVRAIRHVHHFQCRGAGVRPWLVTIARNVSRDTARKASTRLETPTPVLPEARDDDADPARHVLRRQAREELERHIAALSDDQATCVRLRFFAQRSVAETAHSMQRAENAIRALQHQALRKLAAIYAADIGQHRFSTRQSVNDIDHVGVVGSGLMGSGLPSPSPEWPAAFVWIPTVPSMGFDEVGNGSDQGFLEGTLTLEGTDALPARR